MTIRLFARLREIAGAAELRRESPDGTDARGVWDALAAEFPAMAPYRSSISCAVNEEYAPLSTRLKDGDEIAFLPPVSGGSVPWEDSRRRLIRVSRVVSAAESVIRGIRAYPRQSVIRGIRVYPRQNP